MSIFVLINNKMTNIFTRSMFYTDLLKLAKVVLIKENGKPIRYYTIPGVCNDLNDYTREVADRCLDVVEVGYIMKALNDLQQDGKRSTFKAYLKQYDFELIDGMTFDEKYVDNV